MINPAFVGIITWPARGDTHVDPLFSNFFQQNGFGIPANDYLFLSTV
jgi:hypothetical protein